MNNETEDNALPEEVREVITGAVADTVAAEAVVARLAALGGSAGEISIVVEPIHDDPQTPVPESGVCVKADVPAAHAEAARAALCVDEADPTGKGAEGGS